MPSSDYKQTAELHPCPFCQSEAILRNNPRGDMYWIECGHNPTHCQTAPGRREQVVALWNTRPIEDALRAKLAAKDEEISRLEERLKMTEAALFAELAQATKERDGLAREAKKDAFLNFRTRIREQYAVEKELYPHHYDGKTCWNCLQHPSGYNTHPSCNKCIRFDKFRRPDPSKGFVDNWKPEEDDKS